MTSTETIQKKLLENLHKALVSYNPYSPEKYETTMKSLEIPAWLSGGSFYLMGPGKFEIPYYVSMGDSEKELHLFKFQHWFDGIPLIQKFDFEKGDSGFMEINYSSQLTAKGLERKIYSGHSLPNSVNTWSTQSNRSSLSQLFDSLSINSDAKKINADKISAQGSIYVSENDVIVCVSSVFPIALQLIDPYTLLPMDSIQSNNGSFICPHLVQKGKEFYGCSIDFSLGVLGFNSSCTYNVWHVDDDTINPLDSITSNKIQEAGLVHEMVSTDQYLILPVFPYCVASTSAALSFVSKSFPVSSCFKFNSSVPVKFHILSLTTKKHVITFEANQPPVFSFHAVNSWEFRDPNSGMTSVYIDFLVYQDASIMDYFKLDNLRSLDNVAIPTTKLIRYCLKNVNKNSNQGLSNEVSVEIIIQNEDIIELPSINPQNQGERYNYFYGVSQTESARKNGIKLWDSVVKINVNSRKIEGRWSEEGCIVTEPQFIRNPEGNREDDGVLLLQVFDVKGMNQPQTVKANVPLSADITDGKTTVVTPVTATTEKLPEEENSSLLILDAINMEQISRVYLPKSIKKSIHSVAKGLIEKEVSLPVPPVSFGHGKWKWKNKKESE